MGLRILGKKLRLVFCGLCFLGFRGCCLVFSLVGLGSLWFFVLLDFDVFLWVADFYEVVFDSVAVVALEHD